MRLFSLKRNRGILYGGQYGIKQSQGKFIFMLDPDDMFENQIFHYCYNILITEKYDIVDFKARMLIEIRGSSIQNSKIKLSKQAIIDIIEAEKQYK